MHHFYTDEQLAWIIEETRGQNLNGQFWSDLASAFRDRFGISVTGDALRQALARAPKDADSGDNFDQLLSRVRTAQTSKRVAENDRVILTRVAQQKAFISALREELHTHAIRLHAPKTHKRSKAHRTVVAVLSDTHYGCVVRGEEVGGLNNYNGEVAARRTALFISEVADYKPQYRKETDLVVVLNGDILAGIIHDQEDFVLQITQQFAEALSHLAAGLSFLARAFPNVRVICLPGNHGRMMHKANRGRTLVAKWDNFETILAISLREVLRSHKNVQFIIPEAPYVLQPIRGHNFFITHGDTVITVGNPGKIIRSGQIADKLNKVAASFLGADSPLAVAIFGHVHIATHQALDTGTSLLVNGSLSGIDPFAQSIGIFKSFPTQIIFECTDEHAVGDTRFVRLDGADKNAVLDLIIPPPRRPF